MGLIASLQPRGTYFIRHWSSVLYSVIPPPYAWGQRRIKSVTKKTKAIMCSLLLFVATKGVYLLVRIKFSSLMIRFKEIRGNRTTRQFQTDKNRYWWMRIQLFNIIVCNLLKLCEHKQTKDSLRDIMKTVIVSYQTEITKSDVKTIKEAATATTLVYI